MQRILNSRAYEYAELTLLTMGVPLLLSTIIPIKYLLPSLWLIAMYCHVVYRALIHQPERIFWRWAAVNRANLRPLLLRWAGCALLTALLVAAWKPTHLLNLPCERPVLWAIIMVAYPLLSVVPQEIIFRSFFFQRYQRIFPSTATMVLASAVMFGAAHLIFQNYVAPLLCLVGGYFFASTYARTRSLALVAIEHALYGCMVFTLGLGTYFYHGAVGAAAVEHQPSKACAFIAERVESARHAWF